MGVSFGSGWGRRSGDCCAALFFKGFLVQSRRRCMSVQVGTSKRSTKPGPARRIMPRSQVARILHDLTRLASGCVKGLLRGHVTHHRGLQTRPERVRNLDPFRNQWRREGIFGH